MRLRAYRLLGPLAALALAAGASASTQVASATEVGVNIAATSGNYFNSPKVRAAIHASHPAWAAGGSPDLRPPPVNPADYGAFVNYLANAFHGRVAGWEIWNEEDNSG